MELPVVLCVYMALISAVALESQHSSDSMRKDIYLYFLKKYAILLFMENEALDYKIKEQLQNKDFNTLFSSLKLRNEEAVKAILLATAKLAYWRENRLNRALNTKDIAFIIKTAHFHFTKRTDLTVTKPIKLLPKDITCERAQEYFIESMATKQMFDIHERKIIIPDRAIDCFYKDEISGKHKIAPEYYRLYRARRLPWVIPTIEKSNEIYVLDKPKYKCAEYFYIGVFDIPYECLDKEDNAVEKYHRHYFMVMARRKYDMQELTFETEFPIFDYFNLLQYVEKWQPYDK